MLYLPAFYLFVSVSSDTRLECSIFKILIFLLLEDGRLLNSNPNKYSHKYTEIRLLSYSLRSNIQFTEGEKGDNIVAKGRLHSSKRVTTSEVNPNGIVDKVKKGVWKEFFLSIMFFFCLTLK